eukprot:jgi/Undpi1/10072/HiC_scaffold_28.g12526.m1
MKKRRFEKEELWDRLYMRAVISDSYNWHLGWRLEDLTRQAANQRARLMTMVDTLEQLPTRPHGPPLPLTAKMVAWVGGGQEGAGDGRGEREGEGDGGGTVEGKGGGGGGVSQAVLLAKVLAQEEDLNRVVSVECAARPDLYVQVGMHAMVASADASCKVFSASRTLDPHALFEKFELGEGRFALRAFSNHLFLRVVPPDETSDWSFWALEFGAPEVGLPEIFQMRDGMVYSEVMHGYLTCSGQGKEAEVKAFVGEYLWQDKDNYRLIFNQVSDEDLERARDLRHISSTVNAVQRREADHYIAQQEARRNPGLDRARGGGEAGAGGQLPIIAVCVPATSRGTVMNSTDDSPVWTHAFETFLSSTNWKAPKFRFHWYLGFDVGDPIYDAPKAAKTLQRKFSAVARKEFHRQGVPARAMPGLWRDGLTLTLKSYEGMGNAPSYVVSALIQDAYDDGCDYFYQINDDTNINSPDWAETFTGVLLANPLGPNVGVTGPTDTNNRRILTHAFVHRTHIDVFGRYFPVAFKNWWSDDWISNVYGREHTLRDHQMTITHDVRAHKSDTNNRYMIDFEAQHALKNELQKGHIQLSRWLKANRLPPPMLPMVCGYAPLASEILKAIKERWEVENPPASGDNEAEVAGGKNHPTVEIPARKMTPAAPHPPRPPAAVR